MFFSSAVALPSLPGTGTCVFSQSLTQNTCLAAGAAAAGAAAGAAAAGAAGAAGAAFGAVFGAGCVCAKTPVAASPNAITADASIRPALTVRTGATIRVQYFIVGVDLFAYERDVVALPLETILPCIERLCHQMCASVRSSR
jgi:hypothetical protein